MANKQIVQLNLNTKTYRLNQKSGRKRRKKDKCNKLKTNNKMVELTPTMLIITFM